MENRIVRKENWMDILLYKSYKKIYNHTQVQILIFYNINIYTHFENK